MQNSENAFMELVKSEGGKADETPKVIWGKDPLFGAAVVYAYGSFETFKRLKNSLFDHPEEESFSASGLCAFGLGVESIGTMLCLVWANSELHKLENSLPVFMHEIVHLSQDILDWAGVKDSHGEAQAYLVERESERLMREMYNMPIPVEKTSNAIGAILAETLGKPKESGPSTPLLPESKDNPTNDGIGQDGPAKAA